MVIASSRRPIFYPQSAEAGALLVTQRTRGKKRLDLDCAERVEKRKSVTAIYSLLDLVR